MPIKAKAKVRRACQSIVVSRNLIDNAVFVAWVRFLTKAFGMTWGLRFMRFSSRRFHLTDLKIPIYKRALGEPLFPRCLSAVSRNFNNPSPLGK